MYLKNSHPARGFERGDAVVNIAPRPRTECSKGLGITGLRKWAIALTICVLCITVSYYWIDRPVAYFVHNELRGYRDIFDVATRLPKLIGPFVTACTLVLGVRAVTRRHWPKFRLRSFFRH